MQLEFTRSTKRTACRTAGSTSSVRTQSAFSLVTIAAMGSVIMLWLFATAAAVVPMFQRAATGRIQIVLRSAAETGLDYAVAELNKAATDEKTASIDDTTEDGLPKISEVPALVVGESGARVTIAVNNVPAPPWSAVYSTLTDSSSPNSYFYGQANKWRTVASTATYAGLKRTIQVVLEPKTRWIPVDPKQEWAAAHQVN